jgi:hypothetical protein
VRAILAACVLLAGCATPPKSAALRSGEIVSAAAAAKTITIGKSTKADVRAALGEAIVLDFDSGYEVWVYRERPREKATAPANELVLLFARSGILTKTRTR